MSMTTNLRRTVLLLLAAIFPGQVLAIDVERPDVAAFIDAMVQEHGFERETLADVLAESESKQSILDAISRPAEKTLTWAEYRNIFLTDERVQAGVRFWQDHEAEMRRISRDSGVSEEILVGIIGVETYFGRITGNHRVLDALATLAFDYPPRSGFFTRELEEFLLLVREENIDATEPTGSYAGAMGRPQFMPSSYRAYAVDATDDGRRDIWNNWSDVIGSVANYFVAHGWIEGAETASAASLTHSWKGAVPANGLDASDTVDELRARGVSFETFMPGEHPARLLSFDLGEGEEYWVGFHNFFVITRYNRSVMYALAVHQLGKEIAAGYRTASRGAD